MTRNYDELQAAQLEFLRSRISKLPADQQPAHGVIDAPITRENASAIVRAVADTLTKAANAALAEQFRAEWESYRTAVETLQDATMSGDHAVSDMARVVADDACEDFERIAARVSTWLDGRSKKDGE
jgi:hypothetical protein